MQTLAEDSHSLTSQTLNADGTPKRPMNAFMIFARRRRPQVSAQNQSMRTGEISKILSREWVSMPPVNSLVTLFVPLSHRLVVRETILPGTGEAAQRDLQHKVSRLRLSSTTEQLKKTSAVRRRSAQACRPCAT